jgi:hypothetical protein
MSSDKLQQNFEALITLLTEKLQPILMQMQSSLEQTAQYAMTNPADSYNQNMWGQPNSTQGTASYGNSTVNNASSNTTNIMSESVDAIKELGSKLVDAVNLNGMFSAKHNK